MQRTLVIIKPDAMQRGLATPILARLEQRGLRFAGLKITQITPELAAEHYVEHVGKPFYSKLVQYITSFPVAVAAIEGPVAIKAVREAIGKTNPLEAAPGTVRGDFGLTIDYNLIHASADEESAVRELALYFKEDELISYSRVIDAWIGQ